MFMRYHVYKEIWEAATGNSHDRNAVAVEKDGKVVGYLPRNVAIVRFFEERRKRSLHFLKRGGNVHCNRSQTNPRKTQKLCASKIWRSTVFIQI